MKKMLLACALLCAFVQFSESYAQSAVSAETAYVQTSGKAERLVEPDLITLEITLSESNTKGRTKLSDSESALLKVLKAQGIDVEEALSVVSLSSDFRYDAKVNNEALLTKIFNLTLSSSEQLSRVINALGEKNISNIDIIRRECSAKDEIIEELKIEAIKKAKATAEAMAGALGQSIGEAIIINEGSGSVLSSDYAYGRMMVRAGVSNSLESDSEVLKLSFEKLKFNASVSVRFLLNKE